MSSPVDRAATNEETGSPALLVDGGLELEAPVDWPVLPLLELGLRSLVLSADRVSDFTYAELTARPGVRIGTLRLFYRGSLFLLRGGDVYTGGDGPRWYYEAHRAELEWEPRPWLTVWGGAGRSIFREQVRTRTELDGGAAVALGLGRGRLLAGLSGRVHRARHDAYNLWGGTLLASFSHPLGPLSGRARFIAGLDLYPSSEGYFPNAEGLVEPDTERRDLLVKGAVELWSPRWSGARLGLSYEVSHRTSTASAYDYTDHRVMARVSWTLDFDPWAPDEASGDPSHVELPYGVADDEEHLDEERIQDLLRQEDAARRGSSCID
jgi:hypothetical protein